MLKKLILISCGILSLNLACATGLSAPTYVQYSSSMSEKRTAVKSVLDLAAQMKAQKVYIYYHDSKSQELANNISSKIKDKLPAGCSVSVLDQATGEPKYPVTTTPDGVALFVQN